MCYCLFGVFSCAYFLLLTGLCIVLLGHTINRIINDSYELPVWMVMLNFFWIITQQFLQFLVFAMYKMYDPVYKFVSENLGDAGLLANRCNCCEYLSGSSMSKSTKAWVACAGFISQVAFLAFT